VPTFEKFAEEYIDRQEPKWDGKKTAGDWRQTLRDHAYPKIGSLPLNEIDTQAVLRAIEPVWLKTPKQGRRTLRRIETVLDAAAAAGHRDPAIPNPAAWKIMGYLLEAPAAATGTGHESMAYKDVPGFLRSLETMRGAAAKALRFLILTSVRRGELIGAGWDEFDLENRVWTIPVARMKQRRWGDFRVPLSDAAIAILKEIPRTGNCPFPISDSAMPMLLRRKGIKATVHGFRSSFSTWAAEETEFDEEIREACLTHFTGNKVAAAYQRGDLLAKRRWLMERWGNFCCPTGAEVVQLRA
jgi:integrase